MARHILSSLIGFGSGLVVSGAVFAFITMIGVVTRIAQKTGTQNNVRIYESSIMVGGIFGCVANLFTIRIPGGLFVLAAIGLLNGMFFGSLAMSLAEVLDVIPILSRRGRLQHGLFLLILAIALGKMTGSLLYFLIPGFFDAGQL